MDKSRSNRTRRLGRHMHQIRVFRHCRYSAPLRSPARTSNLERMPRGPRRQRSVSGILPQLKRPRLRQRTSLCLPTRKSDFAVVERWTVVGRLAPARRHGIVATKQQAVVANRREAFRFVITECCTSFMVMTQILFKPPTTQEAFFSPFQSVGWSGSFDDRIWLDAFGATLLSRLGSSFGRALKIWSAREKWIADVPSHLP